MAVFLSSAILFLMIQGQPLPGQVFSAVLSQEAGVSTASADFLGQEIKFYPDQGALRAIVGVPPEQAAGVYPLTVKLDSGKVLKQSVKIFPFRFPTVSFWLKPSRKKLLAPDLIQKEWVEIEACLLNESAEQKWGGKFVRPVAGKISMRFGTQEYINRKKSGRHRGLDLAVPTGTQVVAPNAGRVVFAKPLKAFGGTIVVDHGQGIYSLYFHLSRFLTALGAEVTKGEAIALSGNSGISSGPHLHWGMSVHNLRVDPMQWTKISF